MWEGTLTAVRHNQFTANRKLYLCMDVGAWLGDDAGGTSMTFGVITGGVVALCSYNAKTNAYYRGFFKAQRSRDKKLGINRRRDRKAWPYPQYFKAFPQFSALLKHLGRGYNHILDQVTTVDKNEYLTTNKEIIIILGDFHLHHFKETLFDQFIEVPGYHPKRKQLTGPSVRARYHRIPGCSLEGKLVEFLNKLLSFQAQDSSIKLRVIQVGDMYEMWETNFIIRRRKHQPSLVERLGKYVVPTFGADVTNYPSYARMVKTAYDLKKKRRHITPPLNWFAKYGCEPAAALRKLIEDQYPRLFGGSAPLLNRPAGILQGKGTSIPFKMLQGNHDNFLFWNPQSKPRRTGGVYAKMIPSRKGLIHLEHAHFGDPANFHSWRFGYDVTCVNAMAEKLGKGAVAKTIPGVINPDERRGYLSYSRRVADYYKRRKGKRLDVFVMAHTHQHWLGSWS